VRRIGIVENQRLLSYHTTSSSGKAGGEVQAADNEQCASSVHQPEIRELAEKSQDWDILLALYDSDNIEF